MPLGSDWMHIPIKRYQRRRQRPQFPQCQIQLQILQIAKHSIGTHKTHAKKMKQKERNQMRPQ